MSRDYKLRLQDILDAIQRIQSYVGQRDVEKF